LIILVPSDIYTFNAADKFEYRTGFWADRIFKETVSMTGVTEFSINTKNCIVYFLENTGSTNEIEIYASAARSTTFSTPKVGTVQSINVKSPVNVVQ